MKKYFISKNSDKLLMFFAGWGCDEYEFEHLTVNSDVLLLYNYLDLDIDFDFSGYKEFDLIAFSAGVFVASIAGLGLNINKKIAVGGNPYLFDERFGLSGKTQEFLYNITEENADDFARNYLVKTDEEWQNFHNSKRTLDSCRLEFESLKRIYATHKDKINDIYDYALIGSEDPLFNPSAQKEFYKNKLKLVENARHNLFFRINSYEQILNLNV